MVLPDAVVGSSVTTKVLPALRDTTRVWTFTLSNSVTRQFGISSVSFLSSSALGLSWIFFASMDTAFTPYLEARGGSNEQGEKAILPERPEANRAGGPGYLLVSTSKYRRTWVRYSAIPP